MIAEIKKYLRENRYTRRLYFFLYEIKTYRQNKEKRTRRKNLRSNGIHLVHFIQDVLTGEDFFFDMGTLLGIIREGRLLRHDMDIDIGVVSQSSDRVEHIREALVNQDCSLLKEYVIEGIGVVEDSFLKDGIKFDISYYFDKEDESVVYLMRKCDNAEFGDKYDVFELSCAPVGEINKIDFFGKKINVPMDSEDYLKTRYGDNWRIPDKNYKYWEGPSARPTNLKATMIRHEDVSKPNA